LGPLTAAGFTFNQTNTATDYKTGDEFHLEWAATKYLTKEFTIGNACVRSRAAWSRSVDGSVTHWR
jgi:hypothetical protein